MSNLEMWTLIVGFVTPLIVSVINQPSWSPMLKSAIAFVVAAVLGAVTAYFKGNFDGQTVLSSILLVIVTAIATYQGFWKPTTIAPRLEHVTSGQHYDLAA